MTYALATNDRTAKKAAIKRASAAARRDMQQLDRQMAAELEALYRQAKGDIEQAIMGYADRDSTLRLEVLQQLLDDVNGHLQKLQITRNGLLDNDLLVAARSGVQPFTGLAWDANLSTVADDVVRWVHSFTAADGLQLSDRLWRLDRGARETITQSIQSAVIQGHSASKAAQDFLQRGLPVPADVAANAALANAGAIAKQTGRDLLTGEGSAYSNALRVFRTEINRAHGEAYMASGEGHQEFAGWRFLLSPNHPEVDICDMHAHANLYGLGPGVYPSREKCPWPAHPNTLSFVEIVFSDEVAPQDREGKQSRMDWLRRQPPGVQIGVLGGVKKQAAFRQGVLKENQIATPWRVLKVRYAKQGIEVTGLRENVATPITTTWTPPAGTGKGLEPYRQLESIDDAISWAAGRGTSLITGKAQIDAVNSGMMGITRVLDPFGIPSTEVRFDKRLPARVGALAGTSRDGHIRYIHFAPGRSKSLKVAIKDAEENRALHTEQRMRNIERLEAALANPSMGASARASAEKTLARVKAAKRWTISGDANVKDPLAATASHEAGHTLYYVKNLDTKWKTALERNGVTALDTFAVSEYGATSLSELWAEVTSAVHSGISDDIPANVLKAYQEVIDAIDTMS